MENIADSDELPSVRPALGRTDGVEQKHQPLVKLALLTKPNRYSLFQCRAEVEPLPCIPHDNDNDPSAPSIMISVS